jgi:hypothetical protein
LRLPQWKGANLKAWRDGRIILLPWRSPGRKFQSLDIEALGEVEFLDALKGRINTRNVYITIDKDVLSPNDAITNWGQGQMPLSRLLSTLSFIIAHHHAIGVDVTGDYSKPFYSGAFHDVALKKIEAMIDQPRQTIAADNAASINQMSNMAILQCLKGAL